MSELSIYDTIPMQIFIQENLKRPFEESILILLNGGNKVDKIKALLALRHVVRAMEEIPEPTKENTLYPNTHLLIDAKDWYFRHFFHEPERAKFMRAIFDYFIILYEYDKPLRFRIDKVIEFIRNSPNWLLPTYADKFVYRLWYREDDSKSFPWEYDPETVGKVH